MAAVPVLIWCTKTGRPTITGVESDDKAWPTLKIENLTLAGCPNCGGTHKWSKKHAWLQGQSPSIFGNPMMG